MYLMTPTDRILISGRFPHIISDYNLCILDRVREVMLCVSHHDITLNMTTFPNVQLIQLDFTLYLETHRSEAMLRTIISDLFPIPPPQVDQTQTPVRDRDADTTPLPYSVHHHHHLLFRYLNRQLTGTLHHP